MLKKLILISSVFAVSFAGKLEDLKTKYSADLSLNQATESFEKDFLKLLEGKEIKFKCSKLAAYDKALKQDIVWLKKYKKDAQFQAELEKIKNKISTFSIYSVEKSKATRNALSAASTLPLALVGFGLGIVGGVIILLWNFRL